MEESEVYYTIRNNPIKLLPLSHSSLLCHLSMSTTDISSDSTLPIVHVKTQATLASLLLQGLKDCTETLHHSGL